MSSLIEAQLAAVEQRVLLEVVRRAFADPADVSSRLSRLRAVYPTLLNALESLPPTLCHLDAFSRNLLSRRQDGHDQIVAVDWALMDIGIGGDDVGQLVASSLVFGDVAPSAAEELWYLVRTGYLAGLRDIGWGGDERTIRFAAGASMVIRLGFSIPAMIFDVVFAPHRRLDLERRWQVPLDQLLARWGAASIFLLDRADEVI